MLALSSPAIESQVAETLSALPLERRIGQMMMIAFPGPTLDDGVAAFIAEAGIGGVLLFGDNVQSPWQARELTSQLQECAGRAGLPPLLIAADQEGGAVSRFRYPMTVVPSPMAIGATGDPRNAARIAGILANELRELGLNLNLSALTDVNTQAHNPVIGIRSYGDSPDAVAAFAAAAIVAHHEHGVLVAAKHFPGHGDTTVDSHRDLPSVGHDWPRMRAVELPPFAAAIAAGADAILTAHVVYPGIDASGLPATLSKALLGRLLRDEMGFQGIILSDAIEMNAIAHRYGRVRGSLLAAQAGSDVILSVGKLTEQREIHRELLRAARAGELSEEQIAASAARVLRAKLWLDGRDGGSDSGHDPRPRALWPIGDHQLAARQVARESITVVDDQDALLPLHLVPARRLGLIEFRASRSSPVEEREALHLLDMLVRARHGNTTAVLVDSSFEIPVAEISRFAGGCDVLILATRNAALDAPQAALARHLVALGKPTVVLALRSPYDLLALPAVRCSIASYGDQPSALEAAVGVLFGDFVPSGRLPIRMA